MSHFVYTLVAALLLSVAMSLIGNRTPAERLYAATYLFLYCAAATLGGSWAMHWIHG
jgi:hypothetical protein